MTEHTSEIPGSSEGMFRLEGRRALITGAGGHLGTSMAIGLAAAGADVILCGRTPSSLEDVRRRIADLGGRARSIPMDITDSEAIADAYLELSSEVDALDILVNNAYSGRTGDLEEGEPDDFQSSYAVATTAAFLMVKTFLPLLARAPDRPDFASVVNVSSMYGVVSPDPAIYGDSGMNNPPWYGAAKAGLLQLTRYMAVHLSDRGIRVNALVPGPFPAPDVLARDARFHEALRAKVPLGRVGLAQELVGPLLFLASSASSFVTGSSLVVDGGWTAW